MWTFVAIGEKLCGEEKNNDGSNINSCAQGQATKHYSVLNAGKCFRLWNSQENLCGVWCVKCYHKINYEPMGAEIQGKINEYEW